jgi:adenine-specific DNA methylase
MRLPIARVAIFFFAPIFTICAQSTYNQAIVGSVVDSSGAVVPKATVTATNQDTQLTRSATANESGNYVISDLPIGFYSVTASAAGFKKYTIDRVEVTVGQQPYGEHYARSR